MENGELPTKCIIVNGDLFDSWDFRKLKKSHWKVLSHIRKLSKKVHVVWINGNHDGPAEIISHLLGVDFLDEYVFRSGEKKVVALHGDRFDKFISDYPILTKIADNIYRFIQRVDKSFYLAKLAKRSSKTFLRCSDLVRIRAKEYAKSIGADVAICSHTHLEMEDRSTDIEYYNTGCWTEEPCFYLVVKDGVFRINAMHIGEKPTNEAFDGGI